MPPRGSSAHAEGKARASCTGRDRFAEGRIADTGSLLAKAAGRTAAGECDSSSRIDMCLASLLSGSGPGQDVGPYPASAVNLCATTHL